MNKVYYQQDSVNVCKTCEHAKDKFRNACYCKLYGIIVSHGKRECEYYEQVRQQEDCDEGRRV